jgi:hypothetical protein
MNINSRNSLTDLGVSNIGASTVSADDCKANVKECLRLRNTGKISDRRAGLLMDMMTSWIVLANQLEKYEALLKREAGGADQ